MKKPEVTVLMAVHNGEPYLSDTIDSVLAQDYQGFAFLILDDCSTDDTPAIIKAFNDCRIHYVRNLENLGQSRSLHAGINRIETPYISRIDADDLMTPDRLVKQVAYMEAHDGIDVLGCQVDTIDESGSVVGHVLTPTSWDHCVFHYVFDRGIVPHPGVLMRTAAVRNAGGYDPGAFSQDYDLWGRMMLDGCRFTNHKDTLLKYRVHDRQMTRTTSEEDRDLRGGLVNFLSGCGFEETDRLFEVVDLAYRADHCTLGESQMECPPSFVSDLEEISGRLSYHFQFDRNRMYPLLVNHLLEGAMKSRHSRAALSRQLFRAALGFLTPGSLLYRYVSLKLILYPLMGISRYLPVPSKYSGCIGQ